MKTFISLGLVLGIKWSMLVESKDPTVTTRYGNVEGTWKVSRGGRRFQAYEGIPYALPPVGELRFEPPQPVNNWQGQLLAKTPSTPCLQYLQENADSPSHVKGVEDCLYLNVYTPIDEVYTQNRTKLMPVIQYILGGGNQMGQADDWPPHYLMDKDVVFVSFNYRVGPLGFLSTEDRVVPGNMGLKDQSLALKWVSENIETFGGNPNNVTLAGVSSGGSCVHFHFLSPMSRGLFHRGISNSGSVFNCWAMAEASLEKSKKLGALMECPTSDNEQLIRCLKSRPGKKIVQSQAEFKVWLYNPLVPFSVVVESDSATPFIDKSPIEIINSGEAADLPWIASSVTEEGAYPTAEFITQENRAKFVDENWERLAPYLLDYNYTIPVSEHKNVARYIRSYYMLDKPIERRNAADVIRMFGDRLYGMEAGNAAKIQAEAYKSPVWFYYFGYRGEYSESEGYTGDKQNLGVSHADETFYIFARENFTLHTEKDIQMSLDLVNLWYSFASTGVPDMGIYWPPIDRWNDTLNYLRISGPGDLRMESNDNFSNKSFWNTIDFDENKPIKNSTQ